MEERNQGQRQNEREEGRQRLERWEAIMVEVIKDMTKREGKERGTKRTR